MSISIFRFVVLFCLCFNGAFFQQRDLLISAINTIAPSIKNEKIKSSLKELIDLKNDTDSCKECKSILSLLRLYYNEAIGKEGLKKFGLYVCKTLLKFPNHMCEGLIERYSDSIFDNAVRRFFNSTRTCADLQLCENTIEYETIEEYAERVLKNKPETIKKVVDMKSTDIIKVAQISDIHFDEKYVEGAMADCDTPTCCCRDLPPEGEIHVLGGKYGANGKCDLNLNLLLALADELPKHEFDYLLITGDFIRREIWGLNQQDVTRALHLLVDSITKKIGMNIPLIPVIGNHDKYIMSQFKFPENELLDSVSDLFKPWLPEESYQSLKKFGYYTMKIKGIKLIVINCLLCDAFNWHLLNSNKDTQIMINWLENELDLAEKNNEYVHLIDHFPLGNHEQYEQCTKRIRILLERYQNIIQAYISGHSHKDDIYLIKEYSSDKYFYANYAPTAVFPENYKNPSIRIYEIDNKTKLLRDFIQYRMDIAKSNEDKKPYWKEYYRAYKFLNQTFLFDADRLKNINIEGDYVKHRFSDTEEAEKKQYDEKRVRESKCHFLQTDFLKRKECLGESSGSEGYVFYYLGLIAGNFTKLK